MSKPAPFRPRASRYVPIRENDGAWLIWSRHWKCWHRRGSDGGAQGYTNDITEAGIFGFDKARAYNDPPPHRRDAAIPVRRIAAEMRRELERLTRERDAYSTRIDTILATLKAAA